MRGWWRQVDGWVEARRDRFAGVYTVVAVTLAVTGFATGEPWLAGCAAWFMLAAIVLRYHDRNRL